MTRLASTHRRLAAVAAAATLVLAGCGGGQESAEQPAATGNSSSVQVVNAGKLTMCTHLAYPPFEFPDESGKIVGFDVDIANMISQGMGLASEVEIVDVPFEQITSGAAMTAGRCDLGIAGMTITPERANSLLFSEPYFDATQALIVKQGSGITNLAQLQGRRLGVQTDTTGQIYAQDNAQANGYEIVVFEDLPTSVNAVKAGRVDAAINDNGVLFDFAKQNPDTEVVAEFHTGEQYGMGARKDTGQPLIDEANKVLSAIREDGRYDETYKKWFGELPQSGVEQEPGATGAPTS